MASRTGDVRPLNRWLFLFFSINLVAAILFWARPPSSASVAVYVVTHLALLLYTAIDLRAAYGRVPPEELEHTGSFEPRQQGHRASQSKP